MSARPPTTRTRLSVNGQPQLTVINKAPTLSKGIQCGPAPLEALAGQHYKAAAAELARQLAETQ